MNDKAVIGYFITPHGFGHAARSAATMEAMQRLKPDLFFHIFTLIPPYFFKQSSINFEYHQTKCDVGLIQKDALNEDTEATIEALEKFIPFPEKLIKELSGILKSIRAKAVICDISPLGIAAAKAAGLRCFLIENFTWDWIYAGYVQKEPAFKKYIPLFNDVFDKADFVIQTKPICEKSKKASLIVEPVSRMPHHTKEETISRLKESNGRKIILISMGGASQNMPFVEKLKIHKKDYFFIIPAANCDKVYTEDNIFFLPHYSEFYHPDLVAAADAIIGKIGYSTVAEVFYAQAPFGYVPRTFFKESPYLVNFIKEAKIPSIEISHQDFIEGNWLKELDLLCSLKSESKGVNDVNGSIKAAEFIIKQCSL